MAEYYDRLMEDTELQMSQDAKLGIALGLCGEMLNHNLAMEISSHMLKLKMHHMLELLPVHEGVDVNARAFFSS
jgi:hypothetical protein